MGQITDVSILKTFCTWNMSSALLRQFLLPPIVQHSGVTPHKYVWISLKSDVGNESWNAYVKGSGVILSMPVDTAQNSRMKPQVQYPCCF